MLGAKYALKAQALFTAAKMSYTSEVRVWYKEPDLYQTAVPVHLKGVVLHPVCYVILLAEKQE